MKRYRVLVVEDEAIVAMDIEERLAAMGYEVAGRASRGEDAVALADSERLDLILMDVRLQGEMDGIAAAKIIGERHGIPVIFLTAHSEDDTLLRARQANPFAYILKPFEDRELQFAVEIAIQKHADELEIRRINRLYDVLSEVNQAVVRTASAEDLLAAVCRVVVERGGLTLARVAQFDSADLRLDVVAQFGEDAGMHCAGALSDDPTQKHLGTAGRAVLQNFPAVDNDVRGTVCPFSKESAARCCTFSACASFPLSQNGRVWGVLTVAVDERDFFQEKEVALFKEVALDVAFALDKLESDARQRRAEEERLQWAQRYESLVVALNEVVYEHDPRTGRIVWSGATQRVLGYSPEEFGTAEEAWFALIHPDDRMGVRVHLATSDRRTFDLEYRCRRKDGSYVWVHDRGSMMRDAHGVLVRVVGVMRDCTERKQAEDAIKRSEARYRTLVETSPDAVLVYEDGRFSFLNPAAVRLLGARDECELLGRPVLDVIHPECRATVLQRIAQLTEDSKSLPLQVEKVVRLDGQTIEVEVAAVSVSKAGKATVQVIGRDITERKRIDRALEEDAIRRRILIEQSRDGIVILDSDGRVWDANERFASMLGYTREETLALHVWDWEVTCDEANLREQIRVVDSTGDHFETIHRRKDGSLLDVEVSTNAAVFSGEKLIFCVCRDISQRKRAEARLREEQERVARLTEIAPVALYSFCLSPGDVFSLPYASPGFKKILAVPESGWGDDGEGAFSQIHEEDRAAFQQSIADSAKEMTAWHREFRVLHPEKGLIWVEGQSVPAREPDGTTVWHGAIADITQRKKAEEELRKSEVELREAQQIARIGRWTRNFATGDTTWSEGIYALLEADPAELAPSYEAFLAHVHPGDRDLVERGYRKALAERATYENLHRVVTAHGEIKWVRAVGRFDYDADGTPRRTMGVLQDISDIKLAEEALRASEARYRRLFEDATEGIVLADAQTGEILSCNEAFSTLIGYERSELVGRHQSMLHPESGNERALSRNFVAHGGEEEGKVLLDRLLRKDGEIRQVEIKANALELSGRRVLQGFFRDVTDEFRRRHERETMVQLLRLLNDESDLHTLLGTLTSFLQDCTGCEAVGVRLQEGDDFPYYETRGFPPEFVRLESSLCARDENGAVLRDECGVAMLDCMCGNVIRGRFDASLPFFTEKGSFWTNSTSALLATTGEEDRQGRTRNRCNGQGYESVALIPLRHGGRTLGILQLNDPARDRFTEESVGFLEGLADQFAVALAQRQTQAALRRSEQRFAAVAEHSGEVIWEVDAEGLYTYVSRACLTVWGYSPEELIGKVHFFDLRPADGREVYRRHVLEQMSWLISFEDLYSQVVTKDGRALDVLTNGEPVVNEDGSLAGYRGADRNITEQRAAQQLAHKDAERTQFLLELHNMASQMSDKDLFDYALDKAVKLTDSEIGFCHRIAEDENSIVLTTCNTKALDTCTAQYETHYPIELAGNWTDCIREMAPVVYNDYATSPNQKGLPKGHAPLRRFMSIPLLSNGTARLIFGVGNKQSDYTPNDVEQIQLVANELHKILTQREAQEALRNSEQRFRDISEAAGEFIWETDAAGAVQYASERIARVIGFTPEEVLGRDLLECLLRPEEPETEALLREHIEERRGFRDVEVCRLSRSGCPVWMNVTGVPVYGAGGEFNGFRGASLDISERKKAERNLIVAFERSRKQQDVVAEMAVCPEMSSGDVQAFSMRLTEKAAAAIDVERVSIWLLDAEQEDLRCIDVFCSADMKHSSGATLKKEQIAGEFEFLEKNRYLSVHDVSASPQTATYYETYLKPLGITAGLGGAIRVAGRTVGILRFAAIGRSHHWEEDEITFVCQLADQIALVLINQGRREAQAEREKLESQLHQAQKMESIGRLAGGVAHDFNNMLGVILGQAQLSLLQLTLPGAFRESFEEIQEAARRSADLTRQLLAFARRQTVAPKVLDLNDTISGMLKMLRRLIGENIELAWIPGGNLWPVHMDPSQIDQILANLLVNARDAIAETGAISLRTENFAAQAAHERNGVEVPAGEYVLISVQDTGMGIAEDALAHIFEPFFTTKEVGKGTGLGLATVYGIVKQNGGYITVDSRLGEGTTFYIFLNRDHSASSDGAADAAPAPMRGGHETVLLVEDAPSVLRMSETLLVSLGYRTLTASKPSEALAIAAEYPDPIHLLVTDVVMPEMNGRDLAERIRGMRGETRCLFISGYTADVIANRGVLEEGVNFLEKPFAVEALAHKVREILDRG